MIYQEYGDAFLVVASKGGADPPYDEYQAKTDREIPVVMLERA